MRNLKSSIYKFFLIAECSLTYRWFHKFKEAGRLYELRDAIEIYDMRHGQDSMTTSGLNDSDWVVLKVHLDVVKPFEKASKMLGGDTYPAACIVIPMLDQVKSLVTRSL